MRTATLSSLVPLSLLLLARTARAVCGVHSFTSCDDNIVHWFDPLTGEVCDPVDCGGGRAPPKTGPGCPGYTGTVVRSVSYLSCWTPSQSTTPPSTLATSTTATDDGAPATVTSTGTGTAITDTPPVGKTTPLPTRVTNGGSLTDHSLTPPASLPTGLPSGLTTGPSDSGATDAASQPEPTANAGTFIEGPWRAALGAAIGGVIALV